VAIFTSKALKTAGKYEFMRLYDATVLVTEIKGGPYLIQQVYRQMENYMNDHHIINPAKPFEMLVTNRLLVTDTSRWITRVYFPSFLKPVN
jgi:hypothetical protein